MYVRLFVLVNKTLFFAVMCLHVHPSSQLNIGFSRLNKQVIRNYCMTPCLLEVKNLPYANPFYPKSLPILHFSVNQILRRGVTLFIDFTMPKLYHTYLFHKNKISKGDFIEMDYTKRLK